MPVRGYKKPRPVVGNPSDPEGMAAGERDFLEWLSMQNYSPRTVEERDYHLRSLIVWLDERGITKPVEVTKEILEQYQRHLYRYRKPNGDPLSFKSQHSRLVSLRQFFSYLAKSERIPFNPSSELSLPKTPKTLPKIILTEEEVERILNSADVNTLRGIRDRAIMEVLYSTGIRRMEVVNLTVFDLNISLETITVRKGKGQKDRTVPIGERALAWTRKYLNEVRPHYEKEMAESHLFITSFGAPFSVGGMGKHIRDYIEKAGIDKEGACHLFRHTMATLMLENGADTRYIQEILGHADLSTTQIYTKVSIQKLKEIHKATHPAKLKKEEKGRQTDDV